MDAARKRNPIMHSTESLKQAEKTLANYALPSRRRRRRLSLRAQRSPCYFKRLVSR